MSAKLLDYMSSSEIKNQELKSAAASMTTAHSDRVTWSGLSSYLRLQIRTPYAPCEALRPGLKGSTMDNGHHHHHSFLTKLGFATLTCNAAFALYRSRDDPSSAARVRGRRMRSRRAARLLPPEVRARRRGPAADQGRGVGAHDAAHSHVRVQGRAADAACRRCPGVVHGGRDCRRWVLGVVAQPLKPDRNWICSSLH